MKEDHMNAKRTGLLAVAGCAAACAGVAVVPVLLGGAAAGGALAALSGEAGLAVLVAIAAGVAYVWQQRKERTDCGCAPESGCKAGGSVCTLPEVKEPK
jgi:hypothetical protein